MIQINYPEMLQSIKMSIFTADHSALYSLSCSIACIAASFGLLTWYNRMLNDPYGRFDLAAIVRALVILFLTTNFYYTVLVPLDGVTHLVARGITAWADADKDGLMGKINEVYEQAEESRKKDTLLGAFEEEMEGEGATENVDGLSYESSAIVQSLAEATLSSGGDKPGFFKRLWAGAKGFVSAKVGEVINYGGSILSIIASVVVKLIQYVLLSVSSVCLMILGLMGPFVFAFALIPGLEGGIKAWLARGLASPVHPAEFLGAGDLLCGYGEHQDEGRHAGRSSFHAFHLPAGRSVPPVDTGPGDDSLPAFCAHHRQLGCTQQRRHRTGRKDYVCWKESHCIGLKIISYEDFRDNTGH